jgi:hypothetical protein
MKSAAEKRNQARLRSEKRNLTKKLAGKKRLSGWASPEHKLLIDAYRDGLNDGSIVP